LQLSACFVELMEAVVSIRHARFPVIDDSLDDVRGLIDLRLLAKPLARGELQPQTPLAPFHSPSRSHRGERLPRRPAAGDSQW
jgi:CBS domain containing-hemolysin-like protein